MGKKQGADSGCPFGYTYYSHFNQYGECEFSVCPVNFFKRMNEQFSKGITFVKEELSKFEKNLEDNPHEICCINGRKRYETYESCTNRNKCSVNLLMNLSNFINEP